MRGRRLNQGTDARKRQGVACAKAILAGEHFVVWGGTALAIPLLDARLTITIEKTGGAPGVTISGIDEPEGIMLLIEAAAKLPEHRTSLIALSVDANFPPQAGLGWSAAFSVALARAVRAYQGRAPNDDLAAQAGLVYERHFHGCPSGIDSTTIAFEAPCYVKTGRAFVNGTRTRARGPLAGFIDIAPGGVFVVADSGERGSTRQAIEQTARLLDRRHKQRVVGKLTDVAETIALQMATALSRGDFPYVGLMLNESHLLLKALELSTPRLDHLRHVALSAGALGAKLTGSGLGGCLLALCLPDRVQEVAAALRAAGVSTLFTQPTAALMSAKKDAA